MATVHEYDLILTLTGGFAGALVLGYITQRLGLSPIVCSPLGGTPLRPHTPARGGHAAMPGNFPEIGVIVLVVGVGLQFHIEELLAVRRVAVPGAIGQSVIAILL